MKNAEELHDMIRDLVDTYIADIDGEEHAMEIADEALDTVRTGYAMRLEEIRSEQE